MKHSVDVYVSVLIEHSVSDNSCRSSEFKRSNETLVRGLTSPVLDRFVGALHVPDHSLSPRQLSMRCCNCTVRVLSSSTSLVKMSRPRLLQPLASPMHTPDRSLADISGGCQHQANCFDCDQGYVIGLSSHAEQRCVRRLRAWRSIILPFATPIQVCAISRNSP